MSILVSLFVSANTPFDNPIVFVVLTVFVSVFVANNRVLYVLYAFLAAGNVSIFHLYIFRNMASWMILWMDRWMDG